MAKSKVIAVTVYPADEKIIAQVMNDYDCNRSAATRMIIRDYGRMSDIARHNSVTVRELANIFSSFAQDGG